MSKQIWRSLIVISAFVLFLGVMPLAAYAEDGQEADNNTTSESGSGSEKTSGKGAKLKAELQELKQQRQKNKQHRLEENKLRVCEQRKAKIQAIMNRGITRAERQLALFTTIAERVKTFYVDKGYTLDNYNELVAAADTAKADAQANLEMLKSLDGFDCNADDPKGGAEAFKLGLQSINQDLKNYRTAVKNLIVSVKSANPGQEGEKES